MNRLKTLRRKNNNSVTLKGQLTIIIILLFNFFCPNYIYCHIGKDNSNYFNLDNIKSINFSKIQNGILLIDYYCINNNSNQYWVDKINHNFIKVSFLDDEIVEFYNVNLKLQLKIRCGYRNFVIVNGFYNLVGDDLICLINAKNFELKVLNIDSLYYLGFDNSGTYYEAFDKRYNTLEIIRIKGFDIEVLSSIFQSSIPFNLIKHGLTYANKDYAFIYADSTTQKEANKISLNLPQHSILLYGKLHEIPFGRIHSTIYDRGRPILQDSILYYFDFEKIVNINHSSGFQPNPQITSIDQNGNFKVIYKQNDLIEGSIKDFKIFNNYLLINLSKPNEENRNLKGFPHNRIVVIDLKTLKRIDIKKVKFNFRKIKIKE